MVRIHQQSLFFIGRPVESLHKNPLIIVETIVSKSSFPRWDECAIENDARIQKLHTSRKKNLISDMVGLLSM